MTFHLYPSFEILPIPRRGHSTRPHVSGASTTPLSLLRAMPCKLSGIERMLKPFGETVWSGEDNICSGARRCGETPMDSMITAAARALATGDPLGALKRVALRDDAPALALRGIAMAQLG